MLTGTAAAITLPDGFDERVLTSALAQPTAMAIAPDGRIFVCEQGGKLRVIENDALLATPFVTISTDSQGERGLLGVAFHPSFPVTPHVFVYYTVPGSPPHNRISRFTADGNTAVAGSEVVLVDLDNLSGATNHNGGAIHFGSDGKLYAGVGENANGSNAQSLTNRLGKILRYNADGTIPNDNPFSSEATGANRAIWAIGLRNPFTFAFQPGTGRMFLNDVGQNTWEEINDGIAGSNYGWPTCEGSCSNANFRDPLYQYAHSSGGCAIAGGAFYNPITSQFPSDYTGSYFFADLCGGFIDRRDPGGTVSDFATGLSGPVDLQLGSNGALYYLARGSSATTGTVAAIEFSEAPVPQITAPSTKFRYRIGKSIEFAGTATDAQDGSLPPSAFSWTIEFHHDGRIDPFEGPIVGVKSGTVDIPETGVTSTGQFYRIILTVTDSSGGQATATRDVFPRIVTLTLKSKPEGLEVSLDGMTARTPFSASSVSGSKRTISAPSPQIQNGVTYDFRNWSDGGAQTHDIVTPKDSNSYKAKLRAR